MEKLGLGPDDLLSINEKLVYGRMTGWGQDGLFSDMAGHDLNYLSITGALNAIGRKDERPPVPLNLIADYGGGGMLLAVGMLSALIHSQKTGKGQVVDAAMIDGTSMLMSLFYSFYGSGMWVNERESNLLDGSAHFYDTYACKDGKYLAVACIEDKFYKEMLNKLEITDERFSMQFSKDMWPELKSILEEKFLSKNRDEWAMIFKDSDACITPILDLDEAPKHAHNKSRSTFIERDGVVQPNPSPRFSETPLEIKNSPKKIKYYQAGTSEMFGASKPPQNTSNKQIFLNRICIVGENEYSNILKKHAEDFGLIISKMENADLILTNISPDHEKSKEQIKKIKSLKLPDTPIGFLKLPIYQKSRTIPWLSNIEGFGLDLAISDKKISYFMRLVISV